MWWDNIENDPAEAIFNGVWWRRLSAATSSIQKNPMQKRWLGNHNEGSNMWKAQDLPSTTWDASCPLWIYLCCSSGKYVKTVVWMFWSWDRLKNMWRRIVWSQSRHSSCEWTCRMCWSSHIHNPIQAQKFRTLITTESLFDSSLFLKRHEPPPPTTLSLCGLWMFRPKESSWISYRMS